MKKILLNLLSLVLIMLIIPTIALMGGQPLQTTEPAVISPPINNTSDKIKPDQPEPLTYKVLNHKTGEILTLSPLEYIKGVVAAEMPIEFHSNALSAQAIAAHTYALRQIDSELTTPTPELLGAFLTTDYTKNQAFISDTDLKIKWADSYTANMKKLDEAVSSVIDQVIVVDGKPIIAAFHSLSNGTTESAQNVWGQEIAYLQPVISEGDNLSPKFSVNTVLTPAEVQTALSASYPELILPADKANWFVVEELTPSKTVKSVKIADLTLSGKKLREALGLKSASFDIIYKDGNFTFATRGYGHGVGMSQYGADFLARQGNTAEEIIKHYYTGVEIISIKNLQKSIDTE